MSAVTYRPATLADLGRELYEARLSVLDALEVVVRAPQYEPDDRALRERSEGSRRGPPHDAGGLHRDRGHQSEAAGGQS